MPPILFPSSTQPGSDRIEDGGRLINCYAERLGDGAPAPYVIRRVTGLSTFAEPENVAKYRGIWFDGDDTIYVVLDETLFRIDAEGAVTSVGSVTSPVVSYKGIYLSTTPGAEHTHSSVDFGVAASDRRIVVVASIIEAADEPVTMTIGGVSATEVTSPGNGLVMFVANVPTGTSGNVVVTYDSSAPASSVLVWRIGGLSSDTPSDSDSVLWPGSDLTLSVPKNGVAIGVGAGVGELDQIDLPSFEQLDVDQYYQYSTYYAFLAASGTFSEAEVLTSESDPGSVAAVAVAASWPTAASSTGEVTFAKNNASTPDQVLVVAGAGAMTFDSGSTSALNVNSEIPNSVCFGEGYFFFTIPEGYVYASNLNSTTITSTDVVRMEAKAEPAVRGVFYDGELYVFCETHCEVWASNGNPNPAGFPFNRTTVIWAGLRGIHAICGFEDGFGGPLFWVADDNSVRRLVGYQGVPISPPELDRQIAATRNSTQIRCFAYTIAGHRFVAVNLTDRATWIYNLSTEQWHERKSSGYNAWRMAGNTVKAFSKWIGGDLYSGDILEIDEASYNESGAALPFIADSIAMESFPTRLAIPRVDFNFVSGVGTPTVDDPKVKISWSDDGGHTWSDPVERKLGEAGRYLDNVRVNRCGLTGNKGRRWRVQVDDEVYVGLLGGSMEVTGRPS